MNSKNYKMALIPVVLVITLTSCSNPKSTAQYKALETEVQALELQIKETEESITKNSEMTQQIDSLKSERAQLIEKFAAIVSDSTRRKTIATTLGKEACENYERALQLYISTSDDFSAGYQTELDKLSSRPGNAVLGVKDFGTEDTVPESISEYAVEIIKTRCSAIAAKEFYKQCETVDKRLINKNPEAFKGKCIKGTVRISQFDSNTGPCAFQGYLGGGYDVRAQFGQTLDPNTHSEEKDCEWTSKLVEDNFITFWGWGLGAYTYTTSNGGSQTIPAFKMVMYQRG